MVFPPASEDGLESWRGRVPPLLLPRCAAFPGVLTQEWAENSKGSKVRIKE